MPTDGSRDLARFVEAQERTFDQAAAELRSGTKRGHWMWFVFPQIAGLGSSATARLYAIDSLAEAEAYLAHPILGPRLREVTALVLTHRGRTLDAIFGAPDDRKFRSSMTLFARPRAAKRVSGTRSTSSATAPTRPPCGASPTPESGALPRPRRRFKSIARSATAEPQPMSR